LRIGSRESTELRWIDRARRALAAVSSAGRLKELYFANHDRKLYAVPIARLDPRSFATPLPLFKLRTPQPKVTSNTTYFNPAPDGRRFLVNQLVGEEGGARIEILMNWVPPAAER